MIIVISEDSHELALSLGLELLMTGNLIFELHTTQNLRFVMLLLYCYYLHITHILTICEVNRYQI